MTQQQQLGKYQLVRKLAAGGMAEVFLANAIGPGDFKKTLVIKRILPELAAEPNFVQMFLSEARLAARLTHQNIVQIFDFGESEGTYFLAMEYVDGPSLRALIKRAEARGILVPFTICARLISLACEGLAFAHDYTDPETGEAQGLIHRDISPDNILLSRQGAVKVVDFGIAKATGQSHKTESGVVKGKLPYMPPEQLRAKPVDRRADVYALGVVLYELLTGRRPYAAESEAALMQAILYENHKPAAELRKDLPPALRRILTKALSKDRDQRYADCHALQADLEAFITATGTIVTAQQVAHFINRTTTDPEGIPVVKEGQLKTPTPATVPDEPAAPPGLTRKHRPAAPMNEARTANQRAPQVVKQEESRRPTSEPVTAPGRARRPSQPMVVTASNRAPQEQPPVMPRPGMPKLKPQSSIRGATLVAPTLVALLLLVMGSGVVISKGLPWLEPPASTEKPRDPRTTPPEPVVNTQPAPVANTQPAPVADPPPRQAVSAPPGTTVAPVQPTPGPVAPPTPQRHTTPEPRGTGILVLRIYPYATVFVDGTMWGDTPIKDRELPAGPHTVKLVNAELGKTLQRAVNIKAGERNFLALDLSTLGGE